MKEQYFYPALSRLEGRVLEIGFGKGESLAYYPDSCELYFLEKSDKKIQKAEKNSYGRSKNIKFFKGEAENLPFEDNFFDAVVVSFVLCSVNSLEKTIEEIERVLKPGGKFILLEHVRSGNKLIGKFQDILTKSFSWMVNNCHFNRNLIPFINRNNFFHLTNVEIAYILGNLIFSKAYKKSGAMSGVQKSR
jgi:ubiquinone/menaquinone biosynthesis C-methylase UbiE